MALGSNILVRITNFALFGKVAPVQLLNLSKSQFLHLQKGVDVSTLGHVA